MHDEVVILVDVTLKFGPTADKVPPFKDCRETALTLLKIGVEMGALREAVDIISRRFCVRPLALVQWFEAKLRDKTEEARRQIEEIRKWESLKTSQG